MSDTSKASSTATTADAVKINRGGIRAARVACAGLTDSTTNLPIPRHLPCRQSVRSGDKRKAVPGQKWQKVQLESSVIANLTNHGRITESVNEREFSANSHDSKNPNQDEVSTVGAFTRYLLKR